MFQRSRRSTWRFSSHTTGHQPTCGIQTSKLNESTVPRRSCSSSAGHAVLHSCHAPGAPEPLVLTLLNNCRCRWHCSATLLHYVTHFTGLLAGSQVNLGDLCEIHDAKCFSIRGPPNLDTAKICDEATAQMPLSVHLSGTHFAESARNQRTYAPIVWPCQKPFARSSTVPSLVGNWKLKGCGATLGWLNNLLRFFPACTQQGFSNLAPLGTKEPKSCGLSENAQRGHPAQWMQRALKGHTGISTALCPACTRHAGHLLEQSTSSQRDSAWMFKSQDIAQLGVVPAMHGFWRILSQNNLKGKLNNYVQLLSQIMQHI